VHAFDPKPGVDEWGEFDDENGRLDPTGVADGVAAGRNLLIYEILCAGMRLMCRLAFSAWSDDDLGTILYRQSGGVLFDEPGLIVDVIKSVDGWALVIEDAARRETWALHEVMDDLCADDSATFFQPPPGTVSGRTSIRQCRARYN
jgi:hypothetical protein